MRATKQSEVNLAENLSCDYPQVSPDAFTNDAKERWATDFKILLQRRDVLLPRDREMVAQIHSIKRRVLPSGKVRRATPDVARFDHFRTFLQ